MLRNVEVLQRKCDKLVRENNPKWYRFNYNQAWYSGVCVDKSGMYIIFKSYNTYVAIIDLNNDIFCEIGKYSRTTSKHVTQFYNKYYSKFKRTLVA